MHAPVFLKFVVFLKSFVNIGLGHDWGFLNINYTTARDVEEIISSVAIFQSTSDNFVGLPFSFNFMSQSHFRIKINNMRLTTTLLD